MPQESGADDVTGLRAQAESPRRPGAAPHGRPPRPAMSDLTPAPVPRPVPPTTTVKVSRTLWLLSLLLGLVLAIFVVLNREAQIAQVIGLVTDLQPDRAVETIESVAGLVFWCTTGALVAMVLIEGLLVRAMMRRHGRVRFAMIVVVALHIGVAVLADTFALPSTEQGGWFRLILLTQLALAAVALVIAFLPGAAAWFRAGRAKSRR